MTNFFAPKKPQTFETSTFNCQRQAADTSVCLHAPSCKLDVVTETSHAIFSFCIWARSQNVRVHPQINRECACARACVPSAVALRRLTANKGHDANHVNSLLLRCLDDTSHCYLLCVRACVCVSLCVRARVNNVCMLIRSRTRICRSRLSIFRKVSAPSWCASACTWRRARAHARRDTIKNPSSLLRAPVSCFETLWCGAWRRVGGCYIFSQTHTQHAHTHTLVFILSCSLFRVSVPQVSHDSVAP